MSIGKAKAKEFIEEIHHLLLLCNREDIDESIEIYSNYIKKFSGNDVHENEFINTIKSVFNYNKFIKKKGEWNAYELCKKSITRTCPYCNQAYAMTIHVNKRGCRPTLDHYYSKDKYPHLALVLNNLIPSCYSCNSSLKGKADFYIDKHLNPLWDNENIEFKIAHEEGLDKLLINLRDKRNKALLHVNHINACPKTSESIKTFLLKDRYDFIISEAIEFTLQKANYNESIKTGIQHFVEEKESLIMRFDINNYQKYLLGRMYHDLSVQADDL
ncbi:hypothetical protein ACWXV6_21535 [Pantoea ananatis]